MNDQDMTEDLCAKCGRMASCDFYEKPENVRCLMCILAESVDESGGNELRIAKAERDILGLTIDCIVNADRHEDRMRIIAAAKEIMNKVFDR